MRGAAKILVTGLLFLATCFTNVCHAQTWVKFDGKQDMKFTAWFPKQPLREDSTKQTDDGLVKSCTLILDLAEDAKAFNYLYMIDYTLMPKAIFEEQTKDLDAFFVKSIDTLASQSQGKIKSTTVISYKGYPGREVKINVEDEQATMTTQFILIQNRLYIIAVYSALNDELNPDAIRFFNSFESE